MTDTSTEAIGIAISQKSTLIDKDCSRKDKMIRALAAERDALLNDAKRDQYLRTRDIDT